MVRNQLNTLVQIAKIDGHTAEKEIRFIKIIGKVNGFSDEEMDELMKNPRPPTIFPEEVP